MFPTTTLNFIPTPEETALIEIAATGDNDASEKLADNHNILYHSEPGIKGWVRVNNPYDQELVAPITR